MTTTQQPQYRYPHDAIGGKARYNGRTFRVFYSDGEYNEFGVNADNPDRQWVVEVTFSIYKGAAVSRRSYPLGLAFPEANRDEAFDAMLCWLATNG